jgi:hypothetical protein
MKKLRTAGYLAAASAILVALGVWGCNAGPTKAGRQIITIEYQRPSVPCPACPDEPWPYVIVYQHDMVTGSFERTAENMFVASLEVPEDVPVVLNVNDRMMYDGLNECSWNEVGEYLRVNGQPVHISVHDCAAPWTGLVKIIVHPDRSVSQPD